MAQPANPFHQWIRLEQPRLGTRVTFATDDFFAAKERLIQPAEPVFVEDKYDDHGKWMDGWESRRRRTPGYDYCIIRLGVPGVVHGFDIDTSFFTGNYPPQASIDACTSDADVPEDGWTVLLPTTDLSGDAHHLLEISNDTVWTHLRLNIYPDGGVARLRVYGEVRPDFVEIDGLVDLAALRNGGRALSASDEHYGASSVSRSTRHTSKATTPTACRSRRQSLLLTPMPMPAAIGGTRCSPRQNCRWTSNITSNPSLPTSVRSATCACRSIPMVA